VYIGFAACNFAWEPRLAGIAGVGFSDSLKLDLMGELSSDFHNFRQ